MTVENATCPSNSLLSDFGLGKLDAANAETVARHIETCADCRQRVAGISGDSFVGRLRDAGAKGTPNVRRERTYVPGESLANAANSTDGSSKREDGLPRPSRSLAGSIKQDGLGSPSSISAPPELVNHPDYEIIKELGQGGMGTVYLAKNRMMDRMEVLKVISKALLARPGALERFQQEIRSAAKLQHPNIVAAYSVLRPGDLLVFAMEYVKGQDLSQVVKGRGHLPVANAAFYIHQVALGLQHAHEKGMVHRDIKPNNLMLAIEGKKHVVKILDFGLAKATSEKVGETGLTKSGQMLGTPDYVAPEQTLDAHNADIRADIYSLGCTLYFLLSGGPPFQEQSLYEILEAHHKREPKPLNLVRPDVPVELAVVVGKMMAKDPAKRYQTPGEVAKALVPFFKSGQSAATLQTVDCSRTPPLGETLHGLSAVTPVAPTPPPPTPFPLPFATPPVAVAVPMPLPTAEPLSVSIDTNRAATKPRNGWSSLPPWRQKAVVLAAGAAAVLLLGVVLLVRTPHGTIEIALSDRDAKVSVAVDGDHIDINGLDVPLSLDVGEHDINVKGDGYETVTQKFKVTRGPNESLVIKLVPTTPPADGFVSLFNGKDLTGWKTHPSQPGNWRVEGGIVTGSGPATSHLYCERGDFTDFHLRTEARVNNGGDSGVYTRSTFGPSWPANQLQWLDGYAAQIYGGGPLKYKTGSLMIQPGGGGSAQMDISLAPPNQWFTLEFILEGSHLVVKVNGRTTADYIDANRRFSTGHIALQQHPQTVVEFRKIEIKEFQGAAQVRPPIPPPDAQEFGGHWYKFYPEELSWKAARDRCQSNGGHLVIIDAMAENAFVGGLVEKAAWQDAWIGATDEAEEGKWRGVDGELLHFTNWFSSSQYPKSNQPNNKNNEGHYAVMSNHSERGFANGWRWCDQPNESKEIKPGFVCEWEPEGASASTLKTHERGADMRRKAAYVEKELPDFNTLSGTAFQTNSVWANSDWTLTVTWRSGATFTAIYKFRGNELAVTGTITGNKISWRGRDVRIIKGRLGNDDHNGTIGVEGDKIHFVWRHASGRSGTFTVYRK